MPNDFFRVRCGKQPDLESLPYKFSTQEVQVYLGKQITLINNALRRKFPDKEFEDFSPKISALEVGKNFVPLIATFPEDILAYRQQRNNIPSIFEQDMDENSVPIKNEYWRLISNYVYTKAMMDEFKRPEGRRILKIHGTRPLEVMAKYRVPRIEYVNTDRGEQKVVLMFFDPIAVFHDMLTSLDNPRQRFDVSINRVKRLEDGSYQFTLTREVQRKKKQDFNLQTIINNMNKGM